MFEAMLVFSGFIFGFIISCLATNSKIQTIREETDEYIEYMRQVFEERYKVEIMFTDENPNIPQGKDEISLEEE